MGNYKCSTCGNTIHFLDNRSICLNPGCKDGYTLIKNTEVAPVGDRPQQSPERGDENHTRSGQSNVLLMPSAGGIEEAGSDPYQECYFSLGISASIAGGGE